MPENRREINISTEALIKVTLAGLLLFFLWAIRDIVILLLISITIASALEPLVASLHRRKIPRVVSVLAVYILLIIFVVFIGFLVIPPVVYEFKQIASSQSAASIMLQNRLNQAGIFSQSSLTDSISSSFQSFINQITDLSGNFLQKTIGLFNGVIEVITIFVISFYLVAEPNGMQAAIRSIAPAEHHERVFGLIAKIQKRIGLWLIGQFIVSASVFTLTLIGLTLLHVQYALVLAIMAGFFELVPYIGPFISAIPAIFFAFLQSPALAIAVGILYIFIQKTEGYVLVPKVMQKTVGVSPLIILVAILIGLKLAGIFGVFLAVPIVAAINVYVEEYQARKSTA